MGMHPPSFVPEPRATTLSSHGRDIRSDVRSDTASFAQLLHLRASESPNRVAYRFVGDDESAEEITYAELDARARTVAAALIGSGVVASRQPAMLLYAPGLDYLVGLFGCFYAGVPAVPAFPPEQARLTRTLPRLATIIEDATAGAVLTTSDIGALIEDWLAVRPQSPRVIVTDRLTPGNDDLSTPPAEPQSLALLQYTSGSTSQPRGVMLTHSNLIHNCRDIARAFAMHDNSSGALWLPPYHDMGLIGGVLSPLLCGFPVSLMSPMTFLRRPLAWLRMISRYQATIAGGPNFAYELCVRRATDADLETLDLSSLELTFTGAEPIRDETLGRFAERFGRCGFRAKSFYPCYGLAEGTLFVTGAKPLGGWRSLPVARDALELHGVARHAETNEPSRSLVSCGVPGPDTQLLITNPATGEVLAEGAVGEIWIDSPGVAEGYWRRTEETATTFGATTREGVGPYLRTGDLGFIQKGELFVAGRMKDLIVINGRNYHPVDIERVCEAAVDGLRHNCGAAFSIEDQATAAERLVLVYEVQPNQQTRHAAIIDELRRTVSLELSVPLYAVVLVRPRTVPKTSSGKVQRWLTRRQFLAGELEERERWVASAPHKQTPDNIPHAKRHLDESNPQP